MEPTQPVSKADLLAAADKLSYHDRVHLASRIGHAQKGSKSLETLVKDLRTHPAPELPEIEKDDAVADLLPVQKRDTAKFYHEEQLALFAAAAAKDINTLRDELNHPSLMFKQLVCTAIARDDLDDDWLASKILSSSSKVKRELISACLAEHRVAVLDRVAVQVAKEHDGNLIVPKMLHGCSAAVVAELLPKFELSPRISWLRMARFHPAIIFDMFEKKLAESDPYERPAAWEHLSTKIGPAAVAELITHSGQGLPVLRLWEKFPIIEKQRPLHNGETVLPDNCIRRVFPNIITTHMNYYLRHHLDALMTIVISGVKAIYNGSLVANPPFNQWTSPLVPFEKRMEYIKRVISLSNPNMAWYWGGLDRDLMASLPVDGLSPSQIAELVDVVTPWLLTMKRAQDSAGYLEVLRTNVLNLIQNIYTRMTSIVEAGFKKNFRQAQGAKKLPVAQFEAKKAEIAAKRDALNDKFLLKIENDMIHCLDNLFPIWADTWRGKPPAKAEEIIRFCNVFFPETYALTPPHLVRVLMHVFKLLKPAYLDMTAAGVPTKMDRNYTEAANHLPHLASRLLQRLCAVALPPKVLSFSQQTFDGKSPAMIAEATAHLRHVHEYFLKWFQQQQVTNVDGMRVMFGLPPAGSEYGRQKSLELPEDLLKNAFNAIQATTWTALATTDISVVTALLDAVTLPMCQKVVDALLEDKKLGKDEKDQLLRFLRVDDPKNRKLFEKTANANNVADRQFAIKAMIDSTFEINKPAETLLTLKFLRQKVKNEAMEQRVFVFKALFDGVSERLECVLPEDHAKPQEFFDVHYQLLQDFLEAPDASEGPKESIWGDDSGSTVVDVYPIKSFFSELQDRARSHFMHTKNFAFLEFAVQLGWRQDVHNEGKARAAFNFKISIPNPMWKGALMSVSEISTIVEKVMALYTKYLEDDVPDWKEQSSYFSPLFTLAHRRWFEVPILKERAFYYMQQLKARGNQTLHGNLAAYFTLLETILTNSPGGVFSSHEVVGALSRDFWHFVLHGEREYYAHRWWKALAKREKNLTGRAKHEAREKFVDELLAAQPSAIYIPLVWRTLWNRRTNLLDSYIGTMKSFRGPSYKSPDSRKLAAKNTPARKTPVRQVRGVRGGRRGGSVAASAWSGRNVPANSPQLMKEEETKMEASLKKMSPELADHRDLFVLQPVYGMHKLLPRQSSALGEQYRRMIFNVDRPMPERVAAAVRYTLQPAVSYPEMVKFIQARENQFNEDMKVYKEKTAAGESVSEPRPFPTLLMEAVIKGLMSNDEPGAPLGYLLTPQFLGSDLARVAVFAVSRVVPFMPPGSLSRVLKLMLTGKRRLALKVTAFKEIIRMLMKEPSKEHLEIIKHEWNRAELHRDVRIVILTMALHALSIGVPEQEDIAWYILESPVSPDFAKRITNATTRAEIATAILGARPLGKTGVSISKNQIINARLLPHLSSLQKVQVPTVHFTRYSSLVLKVAQTATDPDIKFIALAALIIWNSENEESPEAKELQKFLVDLNHPAFSSEKRSDIARYNEQWRVLSCSLLDFCHMRLHTVSTPAPTSLVIEVVAQISSYVAKLPMKERKNRAMVFSNISSLLANIDAKQCVNVAHYTRADELHMLDTLQQNLPGFFWNTIISRKIAQDITLHHQVSTFKQYYEELFAACVGDGAQVTFATLQLTQMVTSTNDRDMLEMNSIGFEIIDRELTKKTVNGAIQFSFSWAILESLNKLWRTSYFDVDRAVSFFRRAIKFASEGGLPAHVEELPASIQRLTRDIVYRMCPWDSVTKTRTLTPEARKVFQSVLIPLTTEAQRSAMNSTEFALYFQTVLLLLKDNADSVVQAINEEELHALLHLVIVDSLGDLNGSSGAKNACSLFSAIAKRVDDTQGHSRLCAFIEKIMSLSLSGKPVYEPKDYNRLSLMIACELVRSYSFFVQNNTKIFYQFANWCIASFLLDSTMPNPLDPVVSLVKSAFTDKTLFTGRNKDVWSSGPLCEIISAFAAASTISEPHPFSETLLSVTSFKSQYQLVCHQIAWQLVSHYGSAFRELTTQDTVIEWRVEFVSLLEKLCESPFAKIKQAALLQEVSLPATKNDSAPKRK